MIIRLSKQSTRPGGSARTASVPARSGLMRAAPAARALLLATLMLSGAACSEDPESPRPGTPAGIERAEAEAALKRGFDDILAHADSMDDALRPVPLMSASERRALRRYLNPQQLERARALGVRPGDSAAVAAATESGRLVPLSDTTEYWIVRELDHSMALVVPSVRDLLTEIGERFHARLDSLGVPPIRMEVTSVLRTPETQAALRGVNPNAAGGTSTHEYGTTIDIAYNSFAAPANLGEWFDAGAATWLEPHLGRVAATFAESVAARRSRELEAVLGKVLLEMQQEGKVMITRERQQPVFHMTLARRY